MEPEPIKQTVYLQSRVVDSLGRRSPAAANHLTEQTIWEVFEAERPKLVPYAGKFDGFHAVPASVSKTCLVRFDNNKYSVAASAVGRPVEVHAYADRIVIRQNKWQHLGSSRLKRGLGPPASTVSACGLFPYSRGHEEEFASPSI
jgi:hypothetical protein